MSPSNPPYRRFRFLVTPAERRFFNSLRAAAGDDVHISVKVRLGDLVYVPRGSHRYRTWTNKIRQKHVDFVLCDAAAMTPFLAIELDDSTHARLAQTKRDHDKDVALAAGGLPLERVVARAAYSDVELAGMVRRYRARARFQKSVQQKPRRIGGRGSLRRKNWQKYWRRSSTPPRRR